MRRKSVLALAHAKPKRIYQTMAQDDFGELRQRKKDASHVARDQGHHMSPWHRRPNDQYGRWNSFCYDCNAGMVACTEAPEGLDDIYGLALTSRCIRKGDV